MSAPGNEILPFMLRLNALEAKVIGAPAYPASSSQAGPSKLGESSKTALRRVKEIENGVERLGGDYESFRRFIGNYETYLPLLSLPDTASAASDPADPTTEKSTISGEYNLIPDKVKVTMLLEAATDIKGIERDLREVEVLRERGVEGVGKLEDIFPLRSKLDQRVQTSLGQSREMDQVRRQTTELLTKYNDYTNALSDLFLEVHRRLEVMEEGVSQAERRQRREMAERY